MPCLCCSGHRDTSIGEPVTREDMQGTEKTIEVPTMVEPEPASTFYMERRFQKRFRFGCEAEDDLFAITANDREDLESYFRGRKVIRCSDLEDELTGTGNVALAILDTRGREDRDFTRLCQTFPERDVFWLEKCGKSFVAKKEKISTLSEDDLVARPGRVKIVVGDPGSGKTVLLKQLQNRVKIGIGINLGVLADELEGLRTKVAQDKSFKVGASGSLAIGDVNALFGISGPGDDRHLFVDGFDDIRPDHHTIAVAVLKLLRDVNFKIWIIVRPHSRPRLEDDLGVASYSIVAFTCDEERTFLRRHWLSLVSVDDGSAAIDDFVEEYLGVVAALRAYAAHRLVASPLLVKLVAEAHHDDFGSSDVAKPRNLLDLLEAFLRKQFEVSLVERGHDFSDPDRQTGIDDQFQAFRRRLTGMAIRQLNLTDLLSMVDTESATKPLNISLAATKPLNELLTATKLTVNGRFVHRTIAEYLVAKLLAAILSESSESGLRQVVVTFLRGHYFDGSLATTRVLLDRLVALSSPVHVAALDDDLRRLVAVLEQDVGAMVQSDSLGRTALHLAASYCGVGLRRSGDEDDLIAHCKSTLHLMCRSWQQIQICDDLGFNAFSYAVGSLDPGIVAFQEMAKMLQGSGEALSAIASNALGLLRHVERHWAEPRSNFFGYEDLQDLLEGFFGSSEFSRFLLANAGRRDTMAAALHMASPKAIASAMAQDSFSAMKAILASGFFSELLADQRVSMVGLKDWQSEIVLLDDFRSWFQSAVSDCHLVALIAVLSFLDMESMRGLWEMPDVQHLPLFRKAVERMECSLLVHLIRMFGKDFSKLSFGSGLVEGLKRVFDSRRLSEFLDVFKMLPDDYKEEVLEVTNSIKAIDEALESKDGLLLHQLSGLLYSDAMIVDVKAKVGIRNILEFFGMCLQNRDFEMAVPLLRYISSEERHHVWDVLGHRSKFEDLSENYVSFMSGLFKSRLKPSDLHLMLEFLHNYPVVSAEDLEWSVWDHIYCVIYNLEIRKPFPPNIQKCLGDDYVHKVLTNKQSFASVSYLFHLATDEQKRKICLQNDQEFFKFALTNFPQEIINQKCGNGRYLKGISEEALDTEEYSSWFLSAVGQHRYSDLLKLTSFPSVDAQLRLWKKVDYRLLFRDAFQDKEYDFVLNLLKVFKNVSEGNLCSTIDVEEHLNRIPKERTDKLADILSYLDSELATKILTSMDFVHQFQNAIHEKIPLNLNRLFKIYKDFSMLINAMKARVENVHYVEYFQHFLKTKDGEALWALLQYVDNDEKKGAKKVTKYSTSITNAVGLEIALHYASEKYMQQMLNSLNEYSSALTQGYNLSIWQHMLILLGCISYNEPGQFPSHVKQYFDF